MSPNCTGLALATWLLISPMASRASLRAPARSRGTVRLQNIPLPAAGGNALWQGGEICYPEKEATASASKAVRSRRAARASSIPTGTNRVTVPGAARATRSMSALMTVATMA